MNKKNILNATDKLKIIDVKMGFISRVVMYIDIEDYQFNEDDRVGFGMILSDVQDEIKEIRKLLIKSKNEKLKNE